MANSSRLNAPRSAVAGSAAFPAHRALMSLNDIQDSIDTVANSLAALSVLLAAANGAPISADYLHVLLSPLREQLSKASDDFKDMRLVEQSDPLPVLDTAEPVPAQEVRPLASGEVLLRAPGKLTVSFRSVTGDEMMLISGENGFAIRLYRDSINKNKFREWHPSYWSSHESHQDMQGQEWSRHSSIYITDDFGDLVKTGGAA